MDWLEFAGRRWPGRFQQKQAIGLSLVNSENLFREYLKRKYGSVERVNAGPSPTQQPAVALRQPR